MEPENNNTQVQSVSRKTQNDLMDSIDTINIDDLADASQTKYTQYSSPSGRSGPQFQEYQRGSNHQQNQNFAPPPQGFSQQNRNFAPPPQGFSQQNRNFAPPPQGFSQQNRNFAPPPQGFSQQNRNFAPPPQGFSQQNQNFAPSPQGFSQQNRNFAPPPQGFSQQNQNFAPPPQGFSQQNQNFAPPPQGFSQQNFYGNQQFGGQQVMYRPPVFLTEEEITRREVKRSYNRSGICLLIHTTTIYTLLIILSVMLTVSLAFSGGLREMLADDKMDAQGAIVSVLSYSLANIVCAVLGLAMTKRLREFPKMFSFPETKAFPVPFAFMAVLGFQGIIHILHAIYFSVMDLNDVIEETSVSSVNADVLIIFIIYSVILAPITEEIMFRGMILKNLSIIDKRFAVIMSAVLFGLYHENILQMITATLLGILLGYVAIKTDSIIITIGLHMFNNLFVEITSEIPEGRTKTIVMFILYFGVGIISAVIFFIYMRKQDTPDNNYEQKYDVLPQEEKKLKLGAAMSCPAMVIYVIIISLKLLFELFITFIYSE